MTYKYFVLPITYLPANPPYTVWFARWVADQHGYTWSTQRPTVDAPTWAVRATTDTPPPHATVLGSGGKDLPPPPMVFPSNTLSDFQKTFASWLETRNLAGPLQGGLSGLGLPDKAVAKLASLRIDSVEAFSSRVADPTAAERLRLYIEVDPETMSAAVERALEAAPPASEKRVLGGALIRDR